MNKTTPLFLTLFLTSVSAQANASAVNMAAEPMAIFEGSRIQNSIAPAVIGSGNAALKADALPVVKPGTVTPEQGVCDGVDREKVFNTWAFVGGISGAVAGALLAHTWWVGALAGFGIVGVGGILLILIGASIFAPSFFKK